MRAANAPKKPKAPTPGQQPDFQEQVTGEAGDFALHWLKPDCPLGDSLALNSRPVFRVTSCLAEVSVSAACDARSGTRGVRRAACDSRRMNKIQ